MSADTYEVTVSGRLGPVMRNALAKLGVRAGRLTCVIEVVTSDPDALWPIVRRLSDAGYEPFVLRMAPTTTRQG
jgi:hypothetical protein